MMAGWEAACSFVTHNVWAAMAVLLALLGAALTAYAREQIWAAVNWALAPVAEQLPWNRRPSAAFVGPAVESSFTFVQVFLRDATGRRARYEKTTRFMANRPTASYEEAVTAECKATGFATMRGTIARTVVQHGFFVSAIDLGNALGEGEWLTNIYTADLHDSFVKPHEFWTQEFTYPTMHFTLLVHFPAARPPKAIACSVLDGAEEKRAESSARLVDLYGRRSIVWEVANPNPHQVLKLAWSW